MRKGQMTLLIDRPSDTEAVWSMMTEADRTQIVRCYAKAIGEAARDGRTEDPTHEGAQDNDAGS